MKTIKKTIKNILLIAVIFLEIALLSMSPAQAKIRIPSVNEVLTQVERRYHINQYSVQDFAEGFNVSSQKVISPEVKLSFSPLKPRLGEEITATALPVNFQDGEKDLYFNWYLKHKICDENNSPNADERRLCDADGNGRITPNDWKVEAMRLIAQNGFDNSKADYGNDGDKDGFDAVKGGNNNIQNPYCYVHDYISGTDYEVATVRNANNSSSVSCSGVVICGKQDSEVCLSGSFNSIDLFGSSDGSFSIPEVSIITNSGENPYCDPNVNRITCPSGTTPMCVLDSRYVDPTCDFIASLADPSPLATANGAATTIPCTSNVGLAGSSRCSHQFAEGGGTDTGDGTFNLEDEIFWGTDPNNPNTSGNGNLDEANVAGLGRNELTWRYLPGDKVGVIIEGSSFIGTKHDDSSKQITFALPNNIFDGHGDCNISNKSSYVQTIRGYPVSIPAATIDIDDCLEYNLIDPANGDFPYILNTQLSYYPENPNVGGNGINGNSSGGDVLTVVANTSNLSSEDHQIYYKWSVYGTTRTRDDISLLNGSDGGWTDLSGDATFREDNGIELLEGLGMSEFKMQLNNIPGGINFLRVFVEVEEYYGQDSSGSSGKASGGRDNVIIQINNSGLNNNLVLSVGATNICTSGSGTCEVLNNQVVTATLNNGADVNNYLWTLNGKQITFLNPGDTAQGNQVRFLVQGDLGETFALTLIANDTANTSSGGLNSGEKLSLTRNLVIVEPMIGLGPNNELNRTNSATCGTLNGGSATEAEIGTYNTNSVTPTGNIQPESLPDCRETIYDANGTVTVPITYYPSFIETDGAVTTYSVNGVDQGTSNSVDLSSYPIGSIVTVTAKTEYNPVKNIGTLARDWGVSQIESSTPYESTDTIFIKVTDGTVGKNKPSKIVAGLAHNLPVQMIFIFRVMLISFVIVFVSNVLMSFARKGYNN